MFNKILDDLIVFDELIPITYNRKWFATFAKCMRLIITKYVVCRQIQPGLS
jgi:hypothetical protein